jgi:hypothetical protein
MLKIMKAKNILVMSALLASGFAVAESYEFELKAHTSRHDFDGASSKIYVYGLGGAYYFNAVTTANVPLAEAAFLGKNSNVYADASRFSASGQHLNAYQVGAEFYIPENFLYVNAGVTKIKGQNFSDSDWYTSAGITPIDGLLISTIYSHDAGYDANLSVKYVTAIGGSQFINVQASVADEDEGAIKMIGGDFYVNNSLSFGGAISQQQSENTFTLRARNFFTEEISGEISFEDAPDENSIRVGASVRF